VAGNFKRPGRFGTIVAGVSMRYFVSKTSTDGLGNVLKAYISILSINPRSYIVCNPDFMYGAYDTLLAPKHIFDFSDPSPAIWHYGWRLCVLHEETKQQRHCSNECDKWPGFDNPYFLRHFSPRVHIDHTYNAQRISAPVKERILSAIAQLRFLPPVLEQANAWRQEIGDEPALAVAVRTWKAKHEHNVDRNYSQSAYRKAIAANLAGLSTVVLSADTDDTLDEYARWLAAFSVRVVKLHQAPHMNALQSAASKMLAFAHCSRLVAAWLSTYTELIWWFGGCQARVIPVQ
jgi:hypothetical protein